jgi:cholesterol transport system auxiliary component
MACLAGCSTGLLDSDRDPAEVYRLQAPSIEMPAQPVPATVLVPRLRSSPSLNTERIATVQPGRRFDYFEGVRWSDAAPLMLQQLVVDTLSRDGHFALVVMSPARIPVDYTLDIELRRFEAVYAAGGEPPTVVVQLQAALVGNRKPAMVTSFQAEASVQARESRRAAVIEAFDRATAEALGTLATRLREAPIAAAAR